MSGWGAGRARLRDMAERPLSAVVLAAGEGTRMRSERPKPLHLLCGRAMVPLRARRAGRLRASTGSSSSSATAPSGSPRSSRPRSPTCVLDFVEQHVQRGTGDAVAVGLTAFPDDDADDDDGDVLVLPGDTPLLRPATIARPGRPPPRSGRGLHRAHRPPRRPHRLRPGRAGPRRPGRPHRRAARRRRRRARDRRDQHVDLLLPPQRPGPGPAPRPARQRPGRVLPDRRRRGAAEAGYRGRRRRRRRPRRDRTASTTGPSWPRPRPSCAAAPTTLAAGGASPWSTPTAPTSTPPSTSARDVTLFPGTILQGHTVVGAGRRDRPRHPPGRLRGRRPQHASSRPSAATPRSAPTPSSGPSPCSPPARPSPSGTQTGPVLHRCPTA